MGLVLNTDQLQLKEQAKKFVKTKFPVEELRKLRDSKNVEGYSPALWKEMCGLGWGGIIVPENYGGGGMGFQELGVLLEETGRTMASSPLWSTGLVGAAAIVRGASDILKKDLLPKLASGEEIVALAIDEGPHHDPTGIQTKVEKTSSGYQVSGKKRFVADGNIADHLLVAARLEQGPALFLVGSRAKGVIRERRWTVDSRGWAEITLSGAEAYALDAPLDWLLDAGRIGLCAEMLGGILEAFERTLEYLKIRNQFGVPIGSFQALQHRAAKMFCEVELCRSMVRDGLSALDENRKDLAQIASAAKAQLSDTFHLVSNEAVQMHGGIGVTDEHEIGFYLKRARVMEQLLGSARFHRDRYATLNGY